MPYALFLASKIKFLILGQFGTADNLAPWTIWHRSVKLDILDPDVNIPTNYTYPPIVGMICTILMSTSTDMKPPYPGPEGPKDTQQITRTPPIVGMICTILMSTSTDTQPPYPGPKGPKDTQQITYTPPIVGMIYSIPM